MLLFNWSCTADFCSGIFIRDNLWNELNPTLASCTFFPKSGQIPPWKPIPQRLHKIFLIFQGNGYSIDSIMPWLPFSRLGPNAALFTCPLGLQASCTCHGVKDQKPVPGMQHADSRHCNLEKELLQLTWSKESAWFLADLTSYEYDTLQVSSKLSSYGRTWKTINNKLQWIFLARWVFPVYLILFRLYHSQFRWRIRHGPAMSR